MRKISLLVSILLIAAITFAQDMKKIEKLYNNDEITIVIVDSGLGGLSVMAELERLHKTSGHFKKVNLIFANALFNQSGGYNALKNRAEKISTFSKVLTGINNTYKPDIMLIACNTLSVIYNATDFSKKVKLPVIGIVDLGVDVILANKKNEDSKIIIFGTETTINENSYHKKLVKKGVDANKIVSKACPQLQQYIESNPAGDDTEMLIMSYVDEALEQAKAKDEQLVLSLNCSHFGYALNFWKSAVEFAGYENAIIVNPNHKMAHLLSDKKHANRYKTEITTKVVSKIPIEKQSVQSVSAVLSKESEKVSKSLQNYVLKTDLF